MKLKKINEVKKDLGNITSKKITFAPEKDNQLLTYNQIKNYTESIKKKLPVGTKIIVRGMNMMRSTTLYSSYSKEWPTDEQHDDYLEGKAQDVDDIDKFNLFYNFTIDLKFS